MIYDYKWTQIKPSNPNSWVEFLPRSEIKRINAWEHNKNLLRGWHGDVFKDIQSIQGRLEIANVLDISDNLYENACNLYIAANYCGLLSRTCASLLFGEPIRVTPINGNRALQENINRIVQENELQRLNLMQARTSSAQGYTFYRVRWGKKSSWKEDAAVIEAIPGYNVFPHVSSDNIKDVTGYTIAFIVEYNGQKYLRREIHTIGLVENKLNIMDGEIIGQEVEFSIIPEYADLLPQWQNDYPGLFVQHVPNLENIDEFWGASDYEDIESLQDALNNRISSIDEILDKHCNPILVLPTGIMRYDPNTDRYYALQKDKEAIEVNDAELGAKLPRYVTWDAQLNAAFGEIDKLVDLMMLTSQLSPTLFGLSNGNVSDSAKALKIRMVQTLAKINDKQMAYDSAIKNVMYAALWLENMNSKKVPKPEDVRIEWQDGLPDDELEITQIHAARVAGGFESKRNAIKVVQKLEGDDLIEEEMRVREENGEIIDNSFDMPKELD